MTQSGGAKNTFFTVTFYDFLKGEGEEALPAPSPPWALVQTGSCYSNRLIDNSFEQLYSKNPHKRTGVWGV